jgi:Ni/Fe-hydrogenase subunit HybB-like protein
MNSLTPLFIALAVLLPVLVLIVTLHLWMARHRQPDLARIKIFTVLLACLGILALVWFVAQIFKTNFDSSSDFLVPASLCLTAYCSVRQIRQCKRRLGHVDTRH